MEKSQIYRGFRFPPAIISQVVWLYFRFSLSFRDIEELMASRGIIVSCETARQWTLKFGQGYANKLRRRQLAAPADAATRTTTAPLQATRSCTALSVTTRLNQQCFAVSAQRSVVAALPRRPR